MQPILIFRHIECEGPAYLADVLDRYSLPYEVIAVDEGDEVPDSIDDVSGLVFLGGPMSANDEDNWISDEISLIQLAASHDIPMLGHCLGGQLIAKALGADITANTVKEIGWHPVQALPTAKSHTLMASMPESFIAFHWHGETFSIPEGASPLFKSEFCQNQAFTVGKTLAIQCHFEILPEMIGEWSSLYANQIQRASNSIQSQIEMLDGKDAKCSEMHQFADILYRNWLQTAKLI